MTRTSVVLAAGCPVFIAPEYVRTHGGAVGRGYSDLRTWSDRWIPHQHSLVGKIATVAVQGEAVRVLDTDDGVARVELLDQPDGATGYRGFVAQETVGADRRRSVSHLVGAARTAGSLQAGDCVLPAGSGVELIESTDRHCTVRLADGVISTVAADMLVPVRATPVSGQDLIEIAQQYLGAPYLWGGTDTSGIDCSGLIHMTARLGGILLPRDAHYQWQSTAADLAADRLLPGDLIFFGSARRLDSIDHVAFSAGGDHVLHAPEEGRRVTFELLNPRMRARAVAFGRVVA